VYIGRMLSDLPGRQYDIYSYLVVNRGYLLYCCYLNVTFIFSATCNITLCLCYKHDICPSVTVYCDHSATKNGNWHMIG